SKPSITLNGNQLISSSLSGNQWFLDGAIINGATASTLSPLQSGNYTVRITLNGCTSQMSDPFNFVFTGQNELFENEYISLYPNPIKNELIIRYQFNDLTTKINMKVYAANGALINKINEIKSYQKILTANWPNGNLIIVIETPTTQRRFIYNIIKAE
ncbi:MAG: T9SS type A sorting domain-containing protein, partial [Bacteroidota bacterium]